MLAPLRAALRSFAGETAAKPPYGRTEDPHTPCSRGAARMVPGPFRLPLFADATPYRCSVYSDALLFPVADGLGPHGGLVVRPVAFRRY